MKRLLVGFFTTLGLFGCGSTLELSLYTPQTNQLPKGVIFHLPKTELSITFTHTIYETKIFKINDQGKRISLDSIEYHSVIENPITLNATVVADPDYVYVFDSESFHNGFKDTDIKITLDKSGYLAGVNATATDKAAEAISATLETVANVAKVLAVAGTVEASTTKFRDVKLTRKVGIDSFIANCASDSQKCLLEFEVSKDNLCSLGGIKDCSEFAGTPQTLSINLDHSLSQELSSRMQVNNTRLASISSDDKKIVGIPYRTSGIVDFNVSINDTETDGVSLPLLQAGHAAYIPFDSGTFESNTLALVFDTSTGTLTSYQDTSNADATNTLNAFKNSSATILSTLESLQTYELEREKAILEAKQGVKDAKDKYETSESEQLAEDATKLENEKKLLDAERALAKLRAEEDLNSVEAQIKLASQQRDLLSAEAARLENEKKVLEMKQLVAALKAESDETSNEAKLKASEQERDSLQLEKEIEALRNELEELRNKPD